jgi:hypothetical protein
VTVELTWFRRDLVPGGAVHRLVCLPHAGGSASVFKEWGSNLPRIEVQAVRNPGRAERIDEPSPIDLHHALREPASRRLPTARRSRERRRRLFMDTLVGLGGADPESAADPTFTPQRQDNQPEGLVSCRPIGM